MNAPNRTAHPARVDDFALLSALGQLGVDGATNDRRKNIGERLRQIHATAFSDPLDGEANPIGEGHSLSAQGVLEIIRDTLSEAEWIVLTRLVFERAAVGDVCQEAALTFPTRDAVVRRLIAALDAVGPMLGVISN